MEAVQAMVVDEIEAESGGAAWRLVTDQVMGGVSRGSLRREWVDGRWCLRLQGGVRLENGGGFVQMARDLPLEARGFTAVELDVRGNGELYGLHLRTRDTVRPWQSYRQGFAALPNWHRIRLPLAGFAPHRVDAPLDLGSLRRLGLVAIGRAFEADLALARLAFVAEPIAPSRVDEER